MRKAPQVGLVATSPLLSWGVPNDSQRETKSEVPHKWAWWLDHSLFLGGGPQCFGAGDEITNGPQVGLVATSPLPFGGSPTFHSQGQN